MNYSRRQAVLRRLRDERVSDATIDKYETILTNFQNKLNSLDDAPRPIQEILDAVYNAINDALYDLSDLAY